MKKKDQEKSKEELLEDIKNINDLLRTIHDLSLTPEGLTLTKNSVLFYAIKTQVEK
jgi:hypothetical protein